MYVKIYFTFTVSLFRMVKLLPLNDDFGGQFIEEVDPPNASVGAPTFSLILHQNKFDKNKSMVIVVTEKESYLEKSHKEPIQASRLRNNSTESHAQNSEMSKINVYLTPSFPITGGDNLNHSINETNNLSLYDKTSYTTKIAKRTTSKNIDHYDYEINPSKLVKIKRNHDLINDRVTEYEIYQINTYEGSTPESSYSNILNSNPEEPHNNTENDSTSKDGPTLEKPEGLPIFENPKDEKYQDKTNVSSKSYYNEQHLREKLELDAFFETQNNFDVVKKKLENDQISESIKETTKDIVNDSLYQNEDVIFLNQSYTLTHGRQKESILEILKDNSSYAFASLKTKSDNDFDFEILGSKVYYHHTTEFSSGKTERRKYDDNYHSNERDDNKGYFISSSNSPEVNEHTTSTNIKTKSFTSTDKTKKNESAEENKSSFIPKSNKHFTSSSSTLKIITTPLTTTTENPEISKVPERSDSNDYLTTTSESSEEYVNFFQDILKLTKYSTSPFKKLEESEYSSRATVLPKSKNNSDYIYKSNERKTGSKKNCHYSSITVIPEFHNDCNKKASQRPVISKNNKKASHKRPKNSTLEKLTSSKNTSTSERSKINKSSTVTRIPKQNRNYTSRRPEKKLSHTTSFESMKESERSTPLSPENNKNFDSTSKKWKNNRKFASKEKDKHSTTTVATAKNTEQLHREINNHVSDKEPTGYNINIENEQEEDKQNHRDNVGVKEPQKHKTSWFYHF